MQEWALADAVISTALEASQDKNVKQITALRIKTGELQQIDLEIFKFALNELIKNQDILKKTKIKIRTEKAILRCNVCGYEWDFKKDGLTSEESESIHFVPEIVHTYMRCPKCSSPDFEVIKGRGVSLDSIEVR